MSKTTLKPKPNNIELISISFDTTLKVVVGLGKNGLMYFYDNKKGEWFKY